MLATLASRTLARPLFATGSRSMTVISSKSAEEYKKQNYTDRQDKLNR